MRSEPPIRRFLNRRSAGRVFACLVLSLLYAFVFCGAAPAGPLYRYQDENGVVSYTDEPSDPRFKYERVGSSESDKREIGKEGETGTGLEKQGAASTASKNRLSPEDAAEKDRMLKKVAELEDIQKNTDHEKYREMLQSEIDLLKKQLAEIEARSTGKEVPREKAPQ